MGTEKRARQKARRQERLAQERVVHQATTRRKTTKRVLILAGLGLVVLFVVFLFTRGGDDDDEPEDVAAPLSIPDPGATLDTVECPALGGSAERVTVFAGDWQTAELPSCLADGTSYEAVVETDQGQLRFELDDADTDMLNAFVILAGYGYFDGAPVSTTNPSEGTVRVGIPPTTEGFDAGFVPPGDAATDPPVGTVLFGNVDGVPAIELVATDGSADYSGGLTPIGTVTGDTRLVAETVLGLHVAGTSIADQASGSGSPRVAVVVERITVSEI